MKSDKSRETFVPTKHYSSVRLQQGRVLTDADWNEQSDIIEHRDETTSIDVIGQSGAPAANSGFFIGIGGFVSGKADLTISQGRMYVDGILCELESQCNYSNQPDPVFDTNLNTPPTIPTGLVLTYLDVWERHIGVVEDPLIREVALGGPDTATRAKTVWQVKTVAVASGATPASTISDLQAAADGAGTLAARAQPTAAATDPCIIPQAAGFRSLENQLYRVEVHTPGELADDMATNGAFPVAGQPAPTFKWSRDNGSVVAAWINDAQPLPNTVKVQLLTNDPTRGFSAGDWVELSDDKVDLSGFGGTFVQLTQVDGDVLTYDPTTIMGFVGLPTVPPISRSDDSFHPKVRRWDMPIDSGGPQPIIRQPSSPSDQNNLGGLFIDLEAGVQVQFQAGTYKTGDYWMIPARTATGGIEWPPMTAAADSPPAQLAPFGIQHHYTCLATFNLSASGFDSLGPQDCRKVFLPLTDLNPAKPDTEPQPGEFRYYLVDGSRGVGNDANGRVGMSTFSALQAYADAIPFLSLSAALTTFPRDGNDSTAVVMLTPLSSDDAPYDDLILSGVHGYRKILIRCSDFIDTEAGAPFSFDELQANDDWVILGATETAPLSLSNSIPSSGTGNTINVSQATPTGATIIDQLVGNRVRFLPGSSIPDFSSMVLGNQINGNRVETVNIGDAFGDSIPGGTDQFVLGNPAAVIGNVAISAIGGEHFEVVEPGTTQAPFPSISLVGLQISECRLAGWGFGEMAFCEIDFLDLSRFGQIKITPDYDDELDNQHSVGLGVNVQQIDMENGDQVQLQNCVGFDTEFQEVDSVTIGGGFFAQHASVKDCDRVAIGEPLPVPGQSPKLIRLGSNLTSGVALLIADSNADVEGTAFDIRNIHNESGTLFDFDANDGVDLAGIQFTGTGRALRVRDVDLTVASTQTGGSSASGILIDATKAVSSVFDYQDRPGIIVSGLIALPGRSIFRPIELSYTDVRDPANNHFLSPTVLSSSVSTEISLFFGQGRSFIDRGIPVQGTTTVQTISGGTVSPGIARYRVVQFAGDGSSRVRLARIDLKDVVTGVTVSPQTIAASIAGVMQHEIQIPEDTKAFGTVVPAGYTLIALVGVNPSTQSLPALLYCSETWGCATTTPTQNDQLAAVQIGVLVRIVTNNGFGTNLGAGEMYGLARIQVDIGGAAPGQSGT